MLSSVLRWVVLEPESNGFCRLYGGFVNLESLVSEVSSFRCLGVSWDLFCLSSLGHMCKYYQLFSTQMPAKTGHEGCLQTPQNLITRRANCLQEHFPRPLTRLASQNFQAPNKELQTTHCVDDHHISPKPTQSDEDPPWCRSHTKKGGNSKSLPSSTADMARGKPFQIFSQIGLCMLVCLHNTPYPRASAAQAVALLNVWQKRLEL